MLPRRAACQLEKILAFRADGAGLSLFARDKGA
jgi:hypothetical protein